MLLMCECRGPIDTQIPFAVFDFQKVSVSRGNSMRMPGGLSKRQDDTAPIPWHECRFVKFSALRPNEEHIPLSVLFAHDFLLLVGLVLGRVDRLRNKPTTTALDPDDPASSRARAVSQLSAAAVLPDEGVEIVEDRHGALR
jgi:hypothetical protein